MMSRGNPPDCWSLPSDNKWKCPLASSRWPVAPEKPVLDLFPSWLGANGRKRNIVCLERAECRLSSGSVVPAVATGWRKSLGREFAFYFKWIHLKSMTVWCAYKVNEVVCSTHQGRSWWNTLCHHFYSFVHPDLKMKEIGFSQII